MRIEKINDNQIKFILTETDLNERSIKIEELAVPNDKTQKLFKDIMDKALEEYGFESADTPLMVEAVPSASDGIMIIVTRLKESGDGRSKYKTLSDAKDLRKYKSKGINRFSSENEEDTYSDIMIYSFDALDDVINLCIRIDPDYSGSSSLYKLNGRYFLVMESDKELEIILGDYGTKHVSSTLSKYYLKEHGETVISGAAVKKLAKSFS